MPKIIYTNSSAEYWRGEGSLIHVDPSGRKDLDPTDETRIYHFAGTQHVAGPLPQSRGTSGGSRARYPFTSWTMRRSFGAALANLDRWVADGIEPRLTGTLDWTTVQPLHGRSF